MYSGKSSGKAADVQFGQDVADHTAAGLHARRNLGIHEVQRHLHVDLLVLRHALEVDVQDLQAPGMHLVVAQQHLLLLAFQVQRQDGSVERFLPHVLRQVLVIQFDVLRRLPASVEDARHTPAMTQAAARTRALRGARYCM